MEHQGTKNLTPFKPGQSGNPKGKPVGARNRSTIYREHLEKIGKNGKVVDDIVVAAIEKALQGDITALKELMDSGYGKVPDKVIQAETSVEEIHKDVTEEVLKHIPTEELEKIVENNKESFNGPENL